MTYTKKSIVTFLPIKKHKLGVSTITRNEVDEYDYLDQLNEDELKWLKKFHRGWTCSDFSTKGKDLHKSKKMKKDCYNMNNRRARDVYTRAKCFRKLYCFGDGNPGKFRFKDVKSISYSENNYSWHEKELLDEEESD